MPGNDNLPATPWEGIEDFVFGNMVKGWEFKVSL